MILFSGGLDSTYLVYKNLREGNIVYPIYLEILNNEDKVLIEKNQIKLLYNIFSNEYSNIRPITFPMKFGAYNSFHELGLTQAPVWIFGMIYSGLLSNVDEIHVGYVMNDDAISFINDFKRIYMSFKGLLNVEMPPLQFPLFKTKKIEIFANLPEKYKELTITCEHPILNNKGDKLTFNPCGHCDTCTRQKNDKVWSNRNNLEDVLKETDTDLPKSLSITAEINPVTSHE